MKIWTKISAVLLVMTLMVVGPVSFSFGGDIRRTTMKAERMRCSSSLRVIDAELRKVPGVMGMAANFGEGLILVDHEPRVSAEEIAAVISGVGYPAAVVSGQEISSSEANRFQRAGFGVGAECCNPGGASPVAESWKELKRLIFRGR
jgi:copper chaperone CopZ